MNDLGIKYIIEDWMRINNVVLSEDVQRDLYTRIEDLVIDRETGMQRAMDCGCCDGM
jgi:hypothetical protein